MHETAHAPAPAEPRTLPTDVRPVAARVEFDDVALEPPFVISGRPLTHVTSVRVRLEVLTADGRRVEGLGAGMLSVPWAWPVSDLDIPARDTALRTLVQALADQLVGAGAAGDPFQLWQPLDAGLDAALEELAQELGVPQIPRLAGLLALGPVDNAMHDAWSRAAGLPLYSMYTAENLHDDLGAFLPELAGIHPGDSLRPAREQIPVQHALGVGDPLAEADAAPGKRSLEDWIRTDGVTHLKLKLTGDPRSDADKIIAVHELALAAAGRVELSLDPNEAATLQGLCQMLDDLESRAPAAAAAISYLEQPIGRDEIPDPAELRRLASRVPVLLDEGYSRLEQLLEMPETGWSGAVIKAVKGQSHALLTQALAHALGLRIAIQDLTTVDLALEHSVGLAAVLPSSWPPVEYNSRQYAASANTALGERWPELVTVRAGQVRPTTPSTGLHSL